jgi:hypothetical protein
MLDLRISSNLARTPLNKDEIAEPAVLRKAAEFEAVFSREVQGYVM